MKSILPIIISAAALRAIPTEDTHAVRIILLNSTGATQYTLRGVGRRKGKYLMEKDGATGRHILDIPVSIWNQGIPTGRYQDNNSIAHDLLAKPQPLIPFVTMIVPWTGTATSKPAEQSAESPDFINPLRRLMGKLGAPDIVREAFDLVLNGGTLEQLEDIISMVNEGVPEGGIIISSPTMTEKFDPVKKPLAEGKPETTAAKRMREKRARDKAKREAANLQPA